MKIVQDILILALAGYMTIDQNGPMVLSWFSAIIGMITGLIMGDLNTGLVIGGTFQLMSLGVAALGGASAPNYGLATIVGTFIAVRTGAGIESAIAVGLPVGLLAIQLEVVVRIINNFTAHKMDSFAMTEWQEKMHACNGWNSLYWSNHDQARAVSRFGNESPEYRVDSAKMLGTVLHMMQGTPYVYEGEELGMTNVHFTSLEQYRGLEALDIYHDFTTRKGFSPKDTLELLALKSRDNARTPMQWNAGPQARFTTGTPWIEVNANYPTINAESCLADPDSVYYYKKLIELRHTMPLITDGEYELLDPADEKVYVYLRKGEHETLVVAANFTAKELNYTLPETVQWSTSEPVISNDAAAPAQLSRTLHLKPYGAYVYVLR